MVNKNDPVKSDFVPTVGDLFTVSASRQTFDRSYTRNVFLCAGKNDGNIVAIPVVGQTFKDVYVFERVDRYFYDANDFSLFKAKNWELE